MAFEQLLNRLKEYDELVEADAKRFEEIDEDVCQLCNAEGWDKRNLFIRCLYAVHEVVPEAICLAKVEEERLRDRGYYLRICKSCRSRLLGHLGQWRSECLQMREVAKDSDGAPLWQDEEHCIPVRVNGTTRMMTREEYDEYTGRAGDRGGTT